MVHETKLAIRLPGSVKQRLRREARGRFISDSDVAREAIIFFLNKRKDECRLKSRKEELQEVAL